MLLRYHEHADTMIETHHMMFPMVGLVSARVWAGLSEEDRTMISDLMGAAVDGVLTTYEERDAGWLVEIQATDVTYIEGDRAFFGDAVSDWEAVWEERAPEALETIRGVAEATRQ